MTEEQMLDNEPEDDIGVDEEPTDEVGEDIDAEPDEPTEDELPEKYRGKTPVEIARMHREAEALAVRQGQELSALRQRTAAASEPAPASLEDRVYASAKDALDEWVTENVLDMRAKFGYSKEDAEAAVEALKEERWQLEWRRAHKRILASDQERMERELAQAPAAVQSEAVAMLVQAGEDRVTPEELTDVLLMDGAGYLRSTPEQRAERADIALTFLLGKKAREGRLGVAVDSEETPTRQRSAAVLRPATTRPVAADSYKRDPQYQTYYRQQRAYSGLDDSIPENRTRIERMAKQLWDEDRENERAQGRR